MSNIFVSGLNINRFQSLSTIINNMIYNKSGINLNDAAQNSTLATLQAAANNNKIDTSYSSYINDLQTTIDSLHNQSNNVSSKISEMSALKSSYSKSATTLDAFINSIKNSSSNSIYDYSNTAPEVADVDLLTSSVTSQRIEYEVLQVATATIATSNVMKGVDVDKNTKIVDLFAGNYSDNKAVSTRTDIKGSTTMAQIGITTGSFEIGGHMISVNSSDTVNDVIEKFALAGYEAGFDAQNRFYVTSDTESLAIRNQNTNFGEMMGLTVSTGTFAINGYEITISESTTLGNLIDTINADAKYGVSAFLSSNKLELVANKTGNVLIDVTKGSSNFTNAIGFTTGGTLRDTNLTIGHEGRAQSLTGTQDVTLEMTFSLGDFVITNNNGEDTTRTVIEVEYGDTLENIIEKINASNLDVTASIVGGKLEIKQNNKGAEYNMTIESGSSDFTSAVGLTDATTSTGVLSPGLDADYFTHLDGTNVISDTGDISVVSAGSIKINNKTIQLAAGSIDSAIAQINLYSEETGVIAELKDNKVILRNRMTGPDALFIEGGTSNFGAVTGLTTESIGSAHLSVGSAGCASKLVGTENVNRDTVVSASAIKINNNIVNIEEGTLANAINNINAAIVYTNVEASIVDGKLTFTEARNGALPITVEDMSGNFGAITGIIGYTIVAGEEEKYGSTRTTLTTARTVSNSMQISASSVNVNGTSINVSGTIRDAIATINANSVTTGVEAYIDTNNKLTFRAIQSGEQDVNVQVLSGDIGRVIGIGTYSTVAGSASQVEKIYASVTGAVSGLDEYSQILNGSTLKISTKDFNTGAITAHSINIEDATTIGELISRINSQVNTTKVAARLNQYGEFELFAINDTIRSIGVEIGGVGDLGRVTGLGNYTIMGSNTVGDVSQQVFSNITGINNVNASMQIADTRFVLHYKNDAGVDVDSEVFEFTTGQTLQEVINKINTGLYEGLGTNGAGEQIDGNYWYVRADIIDGKFVFTSRAYGPFDLTIEILDNVDGTKGDFGRVVGMASMSTLTLDPTQNRKDPAYIVGGTEELFLDDEIMGTNTFTIWMSREHSLTGVDTQTGTGELASQAVTFNIGRIDNGDGTQHNMTVGELIDAINAQASVTKVKASLENGQFKLTQIDDLNPDDASKYDTTGGANTAEEGDTINYTITGTGDLNYVIGFGDYTTASQPGTGSMSNQSYTRLVGATTVTGQETLAEGQITLTGMTVDNENYTVTINIDRGETLDSVLTKIQNAGVNLNQNYEDRYVDGHVQLKTDYFTDLSISTVGDTDFLRVAGLGKFTVGEMTSVSGTASDNGSHTHAYTKSYVKLDGSAANGSMTIDGVSIDVVGKTVEEILYNINNTTNAAGENVARAELNRETGLLTIETTREGTTISDIQVTGDVARITGLGEYVTDIVEHESATATDLGSHTHAVTKSYTNVDGQVANGTLTLDGVAIEVEQKSVAEILENINNAQNGSGEYVARAQLVTRTSNSDLNGDGVFNSADVQKARDEDNEGLATFLEKLLNGQLNDSDGYLTIQLNREGSTALDIQATGDAARVLGLAEYVSVTSTSTTGTATDLGSHTHAYTKSYVDMDGRAANGTFTIDGNTIDVVNKTVQEIYDSIKATGFSRAELITIDNADINHDGVFNTADIQRARDDGDEGLATFLESLMSATAPQKERMGYLTIQATREGTTAADIQATGDAARILGLGSYSTGDAAAVTGSGTDNGYHSHAVTQSYVKLDGQVSNGSLTIDGTTISVEQLTVEQILNNINASGVATAEVITREGADYNKDGVFNAADIQNAREQGNEGLATFLEKLMNGQLTDGVDAFLIIQVNREGSTALDIQATGDAARVLGLAEYVSITAGSTRAKGTDNGTHEHAVAKSTTILDGQAANGSLTIDGVTIDVVGKTVEEILQNINNAQNGAGEYVARAELVGDQLTIQVNKDNSTAADIQATGDAARILGLGNYSVESAGFDAGDATDEGSHTHAVTISYANLDGRAANGTLTIDNVTFTEAELKDKTVEEIRDMINSSGAGRAEVYKKSEMGSFGTSPVRTFADDWESWLSGLSNDDEGVLIIQVEKENSTAADIRATGDVARILGLATYTTENATAVKGSGTDNGYHTHETVTSFVETDGVAVNGVLVVDGRTFDAIGKSTEELIQMVQDSGLARVQLLSKAQALSEIGTAISGGTYIEAYDFDQDGTVTESDRSFLLTQLDDNNSMMIVNVERSGSTAGDVTATGDVARMLGLGAYNTTNATSVTASGVNNGTHSHAVTKSYVTLDGEVANGTLTIDGHTIDVVGKTVQEIYDSIKSTEFSRAELNGDQLIIQVTKENSTAADIQATGDAARVLGLGEYTVSSPTTVAGSGTDKGSHNHGVTTSNVLLDGKIANGTLTIDGNSVDVIGKTAQEVIASISNTSYSRAELIGNQLVIMLNREGTTGANVSATGDAARVLGLDTYSVASATGLAGSARDNGSHTHAVTVSTVITSGVAVNGTLTIDGQTIDCANKTVNQILGEISSAKARYELNGTTLTIQANSSSSSSAISATGDAARVLGLADYSVSAGTDAKSKAIDAGFHEHGVVVSSVMNGTINSGTLTVEGETITVVGKTAEEVAANITASRKARAEVKNGELIIQENGTDGLSYTCTGDAARILGLGSFTAGAASGGSGGSAEYYLTQKVELWGETTDDWDLTIDHTGADSYACSTHTQTGITFAYYGTESWDTKYSDWKTTTVTGPSGANYRSLTTETSTSTSYTTKYREKYTSTSTTPVVSEGGIPEGYTAITTATQLVNMTAYGKYILMCDIDVSSVNSSVYIVRGDATSSAFKGTLEGNGHTISGLNASLFNVLDGATVNNLYITGGSSAHAELLATNARNNSKIYNVHATGDIVFSGAGSKAGFLGSLRDSEMSYCTYSGSLSFASTNGTCAGLISFVYNSRVSMCYADTSINTSGAQGGLVYMAFDGTEISGCAARTNFSSNGSSYGAICNSLNYSQILVCDGICNRSSTCDVVGTNIHGTISDSDVFMMGWAVDEDQFYEEITPAGGSTTTYTTSTTTLYTEWGTSNRATHGGTMETTKSTTYTKYYRNKYEEKSLSGLTTITTFSTTRTQNYTANLTQVKNLGYDTTRVSGTVSTTKQNWYEEKYKTQYTTGTITMSKRSYDNYVNPSSWTINDFISAGLTNCPTGWTSYDIRAYNGTMNPSLTTTNVSTGTITAGSHSYDATKAIAGQGSGTISVRSSYNNAVIGTYTYNANTTANEVFNALKALSANTLSGSSATIFSSADETSMKTNGLFGNVTLEDTGNLLNLIGYGSGTSQASSAVSSVESDWGGIFSNYAVLTGSVDVGSVKDSAIAGQQGGTLNVTVGSYNVTVDYTATSTTNEIVAAIQDALRNYKYDTGMPVSNGKLSAAVNDDENFDVNSDGYTIVDGNVVYNAATTGTINTAVVQENGKVVICAEVWDTSDTKIVISDSGNWSKLVGLNANTFSKSRSDSTNRDWNGITRGQASLTGSVDLNGVNDLAGQTAGQLTITVGGVTVGTISYSADETIESIVAKIDAMQYDFATTKQVTTATAASHIGVNDDNQFNTGNLEAGSVGGAGGAGGAAPAAGGGSVPAGYTEIYTAEDLRNISADGNYILMNDIDLSSVSYSGYFITSSRDGFSGTLDGNGHTISGIKASLFLNVDGGTVKNLNVIAATSADCNLLAVGAQNNATISNVHASGNISNTGVSIASLLTLINNSTMEYCTFTGNISAASSGATVGGLVAIASNNAVIRNCYVSGTIQNGLQAGGIAGSAAKTSISNCAFDGKLKGTMSNSGTISGYANANTTINNCNAILRSGTPSGDEIFGGALSNPTVTNCNVYGPSDGYTIDISNFYSGGAAPAGGGGGAGAVPVDPNQASYVDGSGYIHYIGELQASIVGGKIVITSDVYQTSNAAISITDTGNFAKLTGLNSGSFSGSRSNSINRDWNGITRGQASLTNSNEVKTNDLAGLTGGTLTMNLSNGSAICNASGLSITYSSTDTVQSIIDKINDMQYDYKTNKQVTKATSSSSIGINDDNQFNTGNLEAGSSATPVGGGGDVPAGYIGVYTAEDLINLSADGNYILMNNIDMSSASVAGFIVNSSFMLYEGFSGTFDGNGHTISGVNCCVFNVIKGGTVKDLNIVAGSNAASGLLANSATNNATISNVHVTGNVAVANDATNFYSAGLINSTTNCTIENCTFIGSIGRSGVVRSEVGGLVASALSTTISNCYVNANIICGNSTGGLAGYFSSSSVSDSVFEGSFSSTESAEYMGLLCGGYNPGGASNCIAITSSSVSNITTTNRNVSNCNVYAPGGYSVDTSRFYTNGMSGGGGGGGGAVPVDPNQASYVDGSGYIHYVGQVQARWDATTGKIVVTSDVYGTNQTISFTDSNGGNFAQLAGLTSGHWASRRTDENNTDWDGINKGVATLTGSNSIMAEDFAGLKAGSFDVYVGEHFAGTVTYSDGATVDQIVAMIDALQYDYDTGYDVSSNFTNNEDETEGVDNDDNEYNTGVLEDGTQSSHLVGTRVHYTAELQAHHDESSGQIVITADVYGANEGITIRNDSGNFAELAGLNAGSWAQNRVDHLNRDWDGIERGQATLTNSNEIKTNDLAGLQGGSLSLQLVSTSVNNNIDNAVNLTITYDDDDTVESIIAKINDMWYDYNTHKEITTPFTDGQAANDDNQYDTGVLEDGSTQSSNTVHDASRPNNDVIHYTGQVQASWDAVTGKIVITSDVYDTNVELQVVDTGNFAKLVGLNAGNWADRRFDHDNLDWNGITRDVAVTTGSVNVSGTDDLAGVESGTLTIYVAPSVGGAPQASYVKTIDYGENVSIDDIISQIDGLEYDIKTDKKVSTPFVHNNGTYNTAGADNDDNQYNTGNLEDGSTQASYVDSDGYIHYTGQYRAYRNTETGEIVIEADVYDSNSKVFIDDTGNFTTLTGLFAPGGGGAGYDTRTISCDRQDVTNEDWNGITKSQAKLESNIDLQVENLAGLEDGSLTITVGDYTALLNGVDHIDYSADDTISDIIDKINDMEFDVNTGYQVTTVFTNDSRYGAIDDNQFNTGNLEAGSSHPFVDGMITYYDKDKVLHTIDPNQNAYVDADGYVHYTAQLQASFENGKITITSDVYQLTDAEITVSDTSNFTNITGLNHSNYTFDDSRTDLTDYDWDGINRGQASLTNSTELHVQDLAGLVANMSNPDGTGTLTLQFVSGSSEVNSKIVEASAGGHTDLSFTYSKDDDIQTIIDKINDLYYDYKTDKKVSTFYVLDSGATYDKDRDDNQYDTGELEHGTHVHHDGTIDDEEAKALKLVNDRHNDQASYVDDDGYIHYIAQVQATFDEAFGKIVITSDVYDNNVKIEVLDTGNFAQLAGLNAGSWADRRSDDLNQDWNGITKSQAKLESNIDLKVNDLAGLKQGQLTIHVGDSIALLNGVNHVDYDDDSTITDIIDQINDMEFDVNTGKKVTSPFTYYSRIAALDDDNFDTGSLEEANDNVPKMVDGMISYIDETNTLRYIENNENAYVDEDGYIHYTAQLQAQFVDGKITITSDVYQLSSAEITIDDTGNFTNITGLNHYEHTFDDQRSDELNSDWNGITKDVTTLTGTVDLSGTNDLAGLVANTSAPGGTGTLTIYVAADNSSIDGSGRYSYPDPVQNSYVQQFTYDDNATIDDIVSQINNLEYDINTGKKVTSPFTDISRIAAMDDDDFDTGVLENANDNEAKLVDGKITYYDEDKVLHSLDLNENAYVDADGYIHYTGQYQAYRDEETGKIVITADVYDTFASRIIINDTGNFTAITGLDYNQNTFVDSRTDDLDVDWDGITKDVATLTGSVTGLSLDSIRPFQNSSDGGSHESGTDSFDVYVGDRLVGTVTYDSDRSSSTASTIQEIITQIENMQYDVATGKYVSSPFEYNSAINDDFEYNTGFIEGEHLYNDTQAVAAGYTIINSVSELSNLSSGGKYILMNNIDLSEVNWSAINFSGELNGNGYVISGLENTSLFNNLSNAQIKNLNINAGTSAGAILAQSATNTVIDNVKVSGNVTSSGYAGGLIVTGSGVTIKNSQAYVTIDGANSGGLVGRISGGSNSITSSYVQGIINGTSMAAGFVGVVSSGSLSIGSDSKFVGTINNENDAYDSSFAAVGTNQGSVSISGATMYNTSGNAVGNASVAQNNGSLSGSTSIVDTEGKFVDYSGTNSQAAYLDGSGQIHYTAQLQASLTEDGRFYITSDIYSTTAQEITLRNDTGSFVKLTGLSDDNEFVTSGTLTHGDEGVYTYVGGYTPGLTHDTNLTFVGGDSQDVGFWVTIDDGSRADTDHTVDLYNNQPDSCIKYFVHVDTDDTIDNVLAKIKLQGQHAIADAYNLHRTEVTDSGSLDGIETTDAHPNAADVGGSVLPFDETAVGTGVAYQDSDGNRVVDIIGDHAVGDRNYDDIYFDVDVVDNQIVIKMNGKYGERIIFSDDNSGFIQRAGLETTERTYAENDTKVMQKAGYDRITGSVNTITKDFVMSNLPTSETFNIYSNGALAAQVTIQNGWSIDEIIRQVSIQTNGKYRAGIYNDATFESNHQHDRDSADSYEYYGDFNENSHVYNEVTHSYEDTYSYLEGSYTYATHGNADIKGMFYIEATDRSFSDTTVSDTDFTRRMGLVAHDIVQGSSVQTTTGDHGYFNYYTDNISGLKPNSIISGIKDGQLTFTLHSLDALINSSTGDDEMGSIEYRPDTTYTINVAYNDTVTSILNKMKQAIYKTEDDVLEHNDPTNTNRIDRVDFHVDYDAATDSGRLSIQIIGNYADSITFDSDTSGIMEALGLDKLNHTYLSDYNVKEISCGKSMLTGSVGSLTESKIFGNMQGGDMVITAGDVTKTINVSDTDRIKDVIDKINEGGTFVAGLDSTGHVYIKTNDQNENAIVITGSSEFASLVGLNAGNWSYTASKEDGHDDLTKITGSVYGLKSNQKFNNMTSGSFTISAAGLSTATINVTQGVTTVGDVISQINASGDYSAELDAAGRLVVSTTQYVGSSIQINSGTTNYTTVVGLTSGTLGGNAEFTSGRRDVFSELNGAITGIDPYARVSAGDFVVTVSQNGETQSQKFVLTGIETMSDVASMISNSSLGISAIFNASDGSMSLKAKNAGDIEIAVKDGTSNFAETAGFTINGAQAQASCAGSLSTLTSTNTVQSVQLLGFSAGTFNIELINTDGSVSATEVITIAQNDTIDSVISKINNTSLGLTAGVDTNGKLVLQRNSCDTAGGIRIQKGSSDFTNKIGFTTGGQEIGSVAQSGADATKSVLKSNLLSAPTAAATLGSLGITDGTFEINGVAISVSASESIASLLSKINATFSTAQESGVYAEFTGGRIVLTGNSMLGGGMINVESGTSNISDILGFTYVSALDGSAQSVGDNAIYKINGQQFVSESNIVSLDDSANIVDIDSTEEVIRITFKTTGSGTIDIGKKAVTDAANKMAAFANAFNAMTTLSVSSTLKNDAEFSALLNSLMPALTDKVGSYSQVGKELGAMGITIYSTKDTAGNEKISIAFNKERFINAYLKDPQKVLDVLVGNDSRPIDSTKAGSMTRLANTLSKANSYFASSISSLNTQAQSLALQIAQNTAELNNITATLALGGADTSFDDMSEYLAQLQAQYDSVNQLIKKLKNNYNQSVTRLALK